LQHTPDDIDNLIGKYLAGEATAEEAARVEAWERASEANGRYISQFRVIFDKACAIKDLQTFHTDAAWDNLKRKIQAPTGKVKTLEPPAGNFSFLRIAASVLIVLGGGYFAYRMAAPKTVNPIVVVAEQQTLGDTLPDGSGVYLNRQTKLIYAFDKKKETHMVKLRGEAYFSINHEDSKKFLVDVGGVFVRDIGTRFNVTAYDSSHLVEVVVLEGEVEFFTEGNSGIRLQAGGKGIYNKRSKTFSIDQPETNVLAYKTKFFSFSNADLTSVAATLNNVYDKKIVLGQGLAHCHLTVSFNNEDIGEIAGVIAETLHLTVREAGNTLILEGDGCETP
jgi:ferric-dicitrate binding protein FerR (iron transport regulator)